jgi:hypothetical protein
MGSLVPTYHPSLEKISGIVRHHWKEIEKCETLTKFFPEPLVVAFWRPESIKNTLHLQRLSPHGLHWPTVDDGLDTAALTSVFLMLSGRQNATTRRGTHWMTLADQKFISLTTIQVGKKMKDNKERVFGYAGHKHYIQKA